MTHAVRDWHASRFQCSCLSVSSADFPNRWQSLAGAAPRVPLTECRLVEKPCLDPLSDYSCGHRAHNSAFKKISLSELKKKDPLLPSRLLNNFLNFLLSHFQKKRTETSRLSWKVTEQGRDRCLSAEPLRPLNCRATEPKLPNGIGLDGLRAGVGKTGIQTKTKPLSAGHTVFSTSVNGAGRRRWPMQALVLFSPEDRRIPCRSASLCAREPSGPEAWHRRASRAWHTSGLVGWHRCASRAWRTSRLVAASKAWRRQAG